jgi:hypothetical protein
MRLELKQIKIDRAFRIGTSGARRPPILMGDQMDGFGLQVHRRRRLYIGDFPVWSTARENAQAAADYLRGLALAWPAEVAA